MNLLRARFFLSGSRFRCIWIAMIIKISSTISFGNLQWYNKIWYQRTTIWKWDFSNFSTRCTFSGFSIVYISIWNNRRCLCLRLQTNTIFCGWFWAVINAVNIDSFECISSMLRSISLFEKVASLIITARISSWEMLSVLIWSKLGYFRWVISISFKSESNYCWVKPFAIFSKQVWSEVSQICW